MSVSKLATSLTVIFTVTVVILVAELLFIFIRRHRLRNPPQPPQPQPQNQNPNHSTKELLYFLCMKTQTRVEPSGPPRQTPDRDSGNDNENDSDTVIDVFKMLEENGRNSRVLCTIKEDDREDGGESTLTTVSGVETVSLQECFEAEVAEERRVKSDVEVEDGKTVFSLSPCDSPMFFTPVGSPTRDGVSTVIGERGDYGG